MNKKRTIVLTTVIIIFLLFLIVLINIISSIKFSYYINWKINIPEPKNEKVLIYDNGITDDIKFSIYDYNNKEIKSLIENKYFKKINISTVRKILDNEVLPVYLNNDIYRNIINENFDDNIINENNYYTYLFKNQSSYCMMIVDIPTNKVYVFSN